MPEIPKPPIPEVVGYPKMSPQIAAAPYVVAERAGEDLQNLALYGMQTFQRIRNAQDHVLMLKAANEVEDEKLNLLNSFKYRTDYDKFPEDMEKAKNDLRKKFQDKYGNNRRVMNILGPHLEGQLLEANQAVEQRRMSLMTDDAKAQTDRDMDNKLRQYAEATDPLRKLQIESEFMENVDKTREHGFITAVEAYDYATKWGLKSEESEIILLAKSDKLTDLKEIDAKLADKSNYPELWGHNPAYVAGMTEYVKRKIDELETRGKAAADRLAINAFTAEAQKRATSEDGKSIDFDRMEQELNNAQLQQEMGMLDANGKLDDVRWEGARRYMDALKSDATKAQEKIETDVMNKVVTLFGQSRFKEALQIVSMDYPGSTKPFVEWRQSEMKAIDERMKSKDSDISNEQDEDNKYAIRRLIEGGASPDVVHAAQTLLPTRRATSESLTNESFKHYKDEVITQGIKRGDKYIEEVMLSSADLQVANEDRDDTEAQVQRINALPASERDAATKAWLNSDDKKAREAARKKVQSANLQLAKAKILEFQGYLHEWVDGQYSRYMKGERGPITIQEVMKQVYEMEPQGAISFEERIQSELNWFIKQKQQYEPEQQWRIERGGPAARPKEKTIHIVSSDGQGWDIPESSLAAAKAKDPNLTVAK